VADEPNLFGVKPKAKRAKPAPLPGGVVQRLIGVYARLFEGRFHEKPMVTPADGAALKRMVAHAGEATVERRLPRYLQLDDTYLAGEGYPLRLMPGAWNRLVAAEATDAPTARTVPDAGRTAAYLRGLKGSK
jgi:hypothetical protein